jgi:hypothetical protein
MKSLRIDNGIPLVSVVQTTESKYVDNQDDLNTQPTATAIMERLQSLETRLLSEIERQILSLKEELTTRFDSRLLSLKEELTAQFTRLASKVEVLNEDTLDVRGALREILKRMSESEENVKAS